MCQFNARYARFEWKSSCELESAGYRLRQPTGALPVIRLKDRSRKAELGTDMLGLERERKLDGS